MLDQQTRNEMLRQYIEKSLTGRKQSQPDLFPDMPSGSLPTDGSIEAFIGDEPVNLIDMRDHREIVKREAAAAYESGRWAGRRDAERNLFWIGLAVGSFASLVLAAVRLVLWLVG